MGQVWAKIRRIWAISGAAALIVFSLWASLAYQATAEGHAGLERIAT